VKKSKPKEVLSEVKCPACDGTGFPKVKQPGRGSQNLSGTMQGMCGEGENCESMTGNQSRLLKVGDRVCWQASASDQGTVVGTNWSEVTIDWDDGHTASIQHNDMTQVERTPLEM